MGLRALLLSGWTCAPRVLKQAGYLGAVALFALGFLPSRAAAQAQGCPAAPITSDLTLTGSITAAAGGPNPCIVIGASGLTVNLADNSINVSALGNSGVAIANGTNSNTTIVGNGGTIVTAYTTSSAANTAAIESTGGTNLTVTGVTLENEPTTGSLCGQTRSDQNWGNGISLDAVSGATISSNNVTCFQNGISVANSSIAHRGVGSISGNTLTYNNFDMVGANQTVYSSGLVLSYSSGWTVNGNTINYNGSYDLNYGCSSNAPNLISCAFGLQIIHNSSSNTIESNTVESNYVGGIYTGPTTSKNVIEGNTVLNNLFDVWDDAPSHSNRWSKNTCATYGGTLNSRACS